MSEPLVGRLQYQRTHRQKNRVKYLAYSRAAYLRRKKMLDEIKLAKGCERCGFIEHPAALEFHHRNPKTKKFTVGHGTHVGLDRLLKEVAKCRILCANCHRILHTKRRIK